jgi:hypothetical protein
LSSEPLRACSFFLAISASRSERSFASFSAWRLSASAFFCATASCSAFFLSAAARSRASTSAAFFSCCFAFSISFAWSLFAGAGLAPG